MNAPVVIARDELRLADLADANEAARLEGFVAEHAEGTVFQRPVWLQAVAAGTGNPALALGKADDQPGRGLKNWLLIIRAEWCQRAKPFRASLWRIAIGAVKTALFRFGRFADCALFLWRADHGKMPGLVVRTIGRSTGGTDRRFDYRPWYRRCSKGAAGSACAQRFKGGLRTGNALIV